MWTPPGREFPGDVDAVRDANPHVSCDPPTLEETRRAVNQLKSGKAPGGCGIYAEMVTRHCQIMLPIWIFRRKRLGDNDPNPTLS